MSTNILCENPIYIFNPAFRDAVLSTGRYVQDGDEHFVPPMKRTAQRYEFPYVQFSPKGTDFSVAWQDSNYAIDVDGDVVSMFWLS